MRLVKETFIMRDDDGKEFHIPAGSYVGIPHHLNATDPKFYSGDPLQFDPERFSAGRQEHRASAFAFTPFSGGRHVCPGKLNTNVSYL